MDFTEEEWPLLLIFKKLKNLANRRKLSQSGHPAFLHANLAVSSPSPQPIFRTFFQKNCPRKKFET
jgi:hypothetical protein